MRLAGQTLLPAHYISESPSSQAIWYLFAIMILLKILLFDSSTQFEELVLFHLGIMIKSRPQRRYNE